MLLSDGAAPVIKDFSYVDTKAPSFADGTIDHFTITFSESLDPDSYLAASHLYVTNDGDFDGIQFDQTATSNLVGLGGLTVDVYFGTGTTIIDTYDDSGQLAIRTQGGISLEDGAGNLYTAATAQDQASYSDGASPLVKDFRYEDRDSDGRIDQLVATFSEEVKASSVFAKANLDISDDGDFDGMHIEGWDNLITGDLTSVAIPMDIWPATAQDTHEDSGTLTVEQLAGPFNLDDEAGNSNTLACVSTAVTYSDGAAPAPLSGYFLRHGRRRSAGFDHRRLDGRHSGSVRWPQ